MIEIIAIIALVALDQWTKVLAMNHLEPLANAREGITIIDGVFELYYTENTGAAFSILNNNTLLLAGLSVLVILIILYFKRKVPRGSKYRVLHVLTVFIIAGALGNLIDRIRLRYVVDMFHFYWFEFPIFNVADIYVTCSAFILIILLMTKYRDLEI